MKKTTYCESYALLHITTTKMNTDAKIVSLEEFAQSGKDTLVVRCFPNEGYRRLGGTCLADWELWLHKTTVPEMYKVNLWWKANSGGNLCGLKCTICLVGTHVYVENVNYTPNAGWAYTSPIGVALRTKKLTRTALDEFETNADRAAPWERYWIDDIMECNSMMQLIFREVFQKVVVFFGYTTTLLGLLKRNEGFFDSEILKVFLSLSEYPVPFAKATKISKDLSKAVYLTYVHNDGVPLDERVRVLDN